MRADASDIGWVGLAASLVLVAVAVGVSVAYRLGLARSLLWASARALVQLLAVGGALVFVLDPDRPLAWAWLWVATMLVVAADTVRRRTPEMERMFPLALGAFGAAAAVALLVLFGLGVFPLEARTLIPMAGIMLGNSMTATVLVGRRVVEDLRDKRDEVEARLALGLAAPDAARPYLRAAMRTALIPQVETTRTVGLVALPGAMTGLLLAGVDPLDAVRIQAAVMFLVLGSVATAVAVVGLGAQRRCFSPDHRLLVGPRPAD